MHFKMFVKQDKWIQAMNEEIDAIEKNDTSGLVDLLEGNDYCIRVQYIYKNKFIEKGEVGKHNPRIVVKALHNNLVLFMLKRFLW